MYNLIIKNGYIVDGTGEKGYKGDVGIKDDLIVRIGDLNRENALCTINAEGLVVSPGFIDIHSHSDWHIFKSLKAENVIRQGVTTEVTGMCGISPFPIISKSAQAEYEYFNGENSCIGKADWVTAEDFYKKAEEKGLSGNIALLVAHGTIRQNVIGYENRSASDDEISQMKAIVEEAMKQGCFGISSGLPYAPGCFADREEIVELCSVVARYDGVYTSHIRNQGDRLIEAIEEVIETGKRADVRIDISHLKAGGRKNWGKIVEAIRIIENERMNGTKVICDVYPYTGAANPLHSMFPHWAQEGGPEKFMERLTDWELREKIKRDMPGDNEELWDITIIASVKSEKNKNLRSKSIRQISKMLNKTGFDVACDLMV